MEGHLAIDGHHEHRKGVHKVSAHIHDSPYNTVRKHTPTTECSLIERCVMDDVSLAKKDPKAEMVQKMSWEEEMAEMKGADRDDLIVKMIEKFMPKGSPAASAGLDDIFERENRIYVAVAPPTEDLFSVQLDELERRLLMEALPAILDHLDPQENRRLTRHVFDTFLRRAERALRLRSMGLGPEVLVPGDAQGTYTQEHANVMFKHIGVSALAAQAVTPDKAAKQRLAGLRAELDTTPEKRLKAKLTGPGKREHDNKARSKALHALLDRLVAKFGLDKEGNVVQVPPREEMKDLTVFESTLVTMARGKMQFLLNKDEKMSRSVASQILVDTMAVGTSMDKSGEPQIQKLSPRRSPVGKDKDFERERHIPTVERELQEATFTPRIGRAPRKSCHTQYRAKSAKALAQTLTS